MADRSPPSRHAGVAGNVSVFSKEAERQMKRAALVAEASRLLNRHGLHGTRLEDIAEGVGLTKTGVSYYFQSKEDLAEACFSASCDVVEDALARASQEPDAARRLALFIHIFAQSLVDIARGHRAPFTSLSELPALNDRSRADIGRRLSRVLGQFVEWVSEAMGEGTIRARRPEPVAYLMLACVNCLDGIVSGLPPADLDRFAGSITDVFKGGLSTDDTWSPEPVGIPAPNLMLPDVFDRNTRNALKREAFLKTGAFLFNQRGFKGVSLNAIAQELGVSRGAFYHHIPDKEHLLEQCFDRTLTIIEDVQKRSEESSHTGRQILEKALRSLTQLQITGAFPLLRSNLLNNLTPAKRRPLETRMKAVSRRFGDYAHRGMEDGSIRHVDAEIVEPLFTGAIFLYSGLLLAASGNGRTWTLSEDPISASIDYVRVLFDGLAAPD